MTARVVTAAAQFGGQIRIEIQVTYEGAVCFRVANLTVVSSPDPAMCRRVTRREMTLSTKLIPGLPHQSVIFASMRIMAFDAPAPLDRISIDCLVLEEKRSPLLRMTIAAMARQFIGEILILPFCKLMAAQARDVLLEYRMVRVFEEVGSLFLMTPETELRPLIEKGNRAKSMNLVALRAVQLLHRMCIETVVVELGVGRVTLRTNLDHIKSDKTRGIPNVLSGRIFNVEFCSPVTTNTADLNSSGVCLRHQPMGTRSERSVVFLMAVQARFIIHNGLLRHHRCWKSEEDNKEKGNEERHCEKLVSESHYHLPYAGSLAPSSILASSSTLSRFIQDKSS